jgi:glycosyltransferase involved in cell wall biosynthesis
MPISEQSVSVVVPVYRGELTLRPLISEITPLLRASKTPRGWPFRVLEVILVHDAGPDRSDAVIRNICSSHEFVRAVWMSRNFGQHAATLAGMAASGGDWVVTIDEDGLQNPLDIGALLDRAFDKAAQVVYGIPSNRTPHAAWRNATSRAAKWLTRRVLMRGRIGTFSSFRLIRGEIARGLAAYCGTSVYLDVALSWVAGRVAEQAVVLRRERDRPSGYSPLRLIGHFWRLVVTSGVGPLRLVTYSGAIVFLLSLAAGIYLLVRALSGSMPVQGWPSLIITMTALGGLTLLSLGIIAEYVGIVVASALGRPLYMTISAPFEPAPSMAAPTTEGGSQPHGIP